MRTLIAVVCLSVVLRTDAANGLMLVDPRDMPHVGDVFVLTTNSLTAKLFQLHPENLPRLLQPGDVSVIVTPSGIMAVEKRPDAIRQPAWLAKIPAFVWEIVVAIIVAIGLRVAHNFYKHPLHLRHLLDEEEDEEDEDEDEKETTPAAPVEIASVVKPIQEIVKEAPPVVPETIKDRAEGKIVDFAKDELRRLLDTPIGK